MSLDVDTVRKAIAEVKAHAEASLTTFETAQELAYDYITNSVHGGHNDWDILADNYKQSWIMLAQMALREIETGDPTPE